MEEIEGQSIRSRSYRDFVFAPHTAIPDENSIDSDINDDDEFQPSKFVSVSRLLALINVEPVILMFSAFFSIILTIQPMLLYRARCIEIFKDTDSHISDDIERFCMELEYAKGNSSKYVDIVEKDISTMLFYLKIVGNFPLLISAPIIGTWSDRYAGRQIPLLFIICGFIIYAFIELLSVFLYELINIYYVEMVALLAFGSFGGAPAAFGMAFSAVSDQSRNDLARRKKLSSRIVIACIAQSLGNIFGSSVATLAMSWGKSSYYFNTRCAFAYGVALAVALLAFIYTFFRVRETHHISRDNRYGTDSGLINENAADILIDQSIFSKLKHLFTSNIDVLCKRRDGWTRLCVILTLCLTLVEFLSLDRQLSFLLLKRPPFSWSDEIFSLYSLSTTIVFTFGIILLPSILSYTNFIGKDSILVMIGILACSLRYLALALAKNSYTILYSISFSFFMGCIIPGLRSFIPSLVNESETARLYTAYSIIAIFCPPLSALIFNNIFNATLSYWPGFVFLIGSILQFSAFFVQLLIHVLMRSKWISDQNAESNVCIVSAEDI